jgi:hypothetical protein
MDAVARAAGVELASLTSVDLHVSMLAPSLWTTEFDASVDRLRLMGPDLDGHRPTFSIRQGAPEQPGEEWFAAFREGAVARMPGVVAGFVQLGRADFVLSSWVDVTAVTYRRDDPSGLSVSQLQAYLWADSYRMYVVDAATARSREAVDLPLFDAMLRSVRLLPEH